MYIFTYLLEICALRPLCINVCTNLLLVFWMNLSFPALTNTPWFCLASKYRLPLYKPLCCPSKCRATIFHACCILQKQWQEIVRWNFLKKYFLRVYWCTCTCICWKSSVWRHTYRAYQAIHQSTPHPGCWQLLCIWLYLSEVDYHIWAPLFGLNWCCCTKPWPFISVY